MTPPPPLLMPIFLSRLPSTLPPQDFQSDADANDMKYFGPRIVSNAYTIDQAMNGLENFNTEIS